VTGYDRSARTTWADAGLSAGLQSRGRRPARGAVANDRQVEAIHGSYPAERRLPAMSRPRENGRAATAGPHPQTSFFDPPFFGPLDSLVNPSLD